MLDPDNAIYVSAVSYWEISLKFAIGKLELDGVHPEELPETARESGIESIALTGEIAASFHQFPKIEHKDPFDRIIIWQTIKEKMILISKDKQMDAYERFGLKLVW